MKENDVRQVKAADIKKECTILYAACATLHAIMVLCFVTLKIEPMIYLNIGGIAFFILGIFGMRRSVHTRRWIFLMSTEFLAIVSVCNIYLGWGYGYLLYGVMMIPIVYYFMYLDNGNVKSAVPHYIAFIDLFMITFTAMIGRDYNKIAWVGDNQVLGMLMGNTLFSIVALIFYSGRFITEIRHTTKHLAYRADYDMLTGVLNREGFNERAAKMLKNNPDTKYVMVCSDVKDFKMINDIYGDEVGDKVLIKEAELLKNIADGRTVYGRIGGDRFAICLPKELFKEEQFVENIVTMKKTFSTG